MRFQTGRRRAAVVALPVAILLTGAAPAGIADAGACPWGGPGVGMIGGGYGMGGAGMMGGMMGGGMMGMGGAGMGFGGMGPGMMGGFGPGPLAALDLTDAQREKIREILHEQRKLQWEIGGKILDEQAELQEIYADATPDPKKAGAVYGRIAKLQQQQLEAQLAARNRIHATLTKEQRADRAVARRFDARVRSGRHVRPGHDAAVVGGPAFPRISGKGAGTGSPQADSAAE